MSAVDLAPPLSGYTISKTERVVYLPAVMSEDEGKGNVGLLLLSLQETHDVVIVPGVVSERLLGMLQRRGYHAEMHYAKEMDESVECWVWRA